MKYLTEKRQRKTVKKSVNFTENNWNRVYALITNGCYTDGVDAVNDLVRRGLPLVENETGIKARM